jgi:nicotinamide riboside kinase
VALIGTHGVGKTTLCYEMAAQVKRLDHHVELVTEVARRCPLAINETTTWDAQAWILHTHIADEIAASRARHGLVLTDRSVLDNYTYLALRAGRQADLEPMVVSWLATYDLLVKVPITGAPSFDGTRATDVAFQHAVDTLLDALIGDMAVPVVRLDPAARDGWVHTVLAHLGIPSTRAQRSLFEALWARRQSPDPLGRE